MRPTVVIERNFHKYDLRHRGRVSRDAGCTTSDCRYRDLNGNVKISRSFAAFKFRWAFVILATGLSFFSLRGTLVVTLPYTMTLISAQYQLFIIQTSARARTHSYLNTLISHPAFPKAVLESNLSSATIPGNRPRRLKRNTGLVIYL